MRHVTELLQAAATVAYTSSGYSALRMARERPGAPIIGMTPRLAVARRLALVWGVRAVLCHDVADVPEITDLAFATARRAGVGGAEKPSSFRPACRSAYPARPTCCALRRSTERTLFMSTIRQIRGFEILDSRGNPTVAAEV